MRDLSRGGNSLGRLFFPPPVWKTFFNKHKMLSLLDDGLLGRYLRVFRRVQRPISLRYKASPPPPALSQSAPLAPLGLLRSLY